MRKLKYSLLLFSALFTLGLVGSGCTALKENFNSKNCVMKYTEQYKINNETPDESAQPGIFAGQNSYSEALLSNCRTHDASFPQNFEGLRLF